MTLRLLLSTLASGAMALASSAFAQSTFTGTAVAEHSGLCLEVPGAVSTEGVQLVQNTCNGRPEQNIRFQVVDSARQIYNLVATHSNMCLSADPSNGSNGSALTQRACSNPASNLALQFQIARMDATSNRFRIRNAGHGRCVEIGAVDTRPNRPVSFFDCQGLTVSRNQNWRLAGAAAAGFGSGSPPTVAQADAARFLEQASFGPTISEIDRVVSMGYDAWITDQFNRPASLHLATHQAIEDDINRASGGARCDNSWTCMLTRHDTWWQLAVQGDDQLRQRVAFALSQFFVVSEVGADVSYSHLAMSNYYDELVVHGLGNYRTLLEETTLSPQMGRYLGMLQNDGEWPDENFAREVMQLFSIGLVELNIDGTPRLDANGRTIPTYNNARITDLARALTGWNFGNAPHWWVWEADVGTAGLLMPMRPEAGRHFNTRAMTLLNGVTIPAGGTHQSDLKIALDNIFNHPNVGPFLARHMIQRLVTSNPSPAYIRRVAERFNNNGSGVRGDMRAVVRAVLMDPEARDVALLGRQDTGKVKEPLIRVAHALRAFNAEGQSLYGATRPLLRNRDAGWDLRQSVMASPSVFNFYRPNYQPTGDLRRRGIFAPELQLLNEDSAISALNHFNRRFERTDRDSVHPSEGFWGPSTSEARLRLNFSAEKPLAVAPEKLVDRMNLLLMGGRMPPDMRSILIASTYATPMNDGGADRVEDLVFLIVSSSQFAVQR